MKRIIIRLSHCLACVAVLLALQVGASESATAKLHINLREKPDLSSRITAILDTGVVVEILGSSGEFVQVRRASGGTPGYVKAKYLQMQGPVAANAPAIELPQTAVVPPPADVPPPPPLPPQPVTEAPVAGAQCPCPSAGTATIAGAPPPPTPALGSHWYGRVIAGVGFSTESAHDLQQSFQGAGSTATVSHLNTRSAAVAADAGYRLSRHFGIEAGLMDLGRYKAQIQVTGADAQTIQNTLNKHYPFSGWGADLALAAHQDLGPWDLGLVAGGYCSFDTDTEIDTGGNGPSQASGQTCGALLGGSVDRQLSAAWSLGLIAKAVWLNSPQVVTGLTLTYRP